MIQIKTQDEIEQMRAAGSVVAQILDELKSLVEEGNTTFDLDQFAEKRCAELGVIPAFKGYHGFPACLCVSVNNEVIHGIPSRKRKLKNGDIVGLDFGVIRSGWFGDSAKTYPVGKIDDKTSNLLKITEESLFRGIEQCRPGNRLFDIGHAVQFHVESFGYSVVREFVGHGIGRALHEDPQVPNYGPKGKGLALKEGMVLAIEPMVNVGKPDVKILDDGWTAVTVDQSLSAHFEHTVAITSEGPEILTLVRNEK